MTVYSTRLSPIYFPLAYIFTRMSTLSSVDPTSPLLDLTSAARELGVHYQTAYRWVRTGRLPAFLVDGKYAVSPTDIHALRRARSRPSRPTVPDQSRIAGKSETLRAALVAGDEQQVRRIARSLVQEGAPIRDLVTLGLSPALRQIGQAWHDGQLTVGTEHRASAIVERVLAELAPNPRGRRRGTVLVAAIQGDRHSLPTTMAAVALREDNWNVQHLGADMPVAEIISFCATEPLDLVVLTVTEPKLVKAAQAAAASLRALGIAVIVGGPGRTLGELLALARSTARKPSFRPNHQSKD